MLEQNKEERAALNLKSFIINIVVGLSFQFCLLYLDHIYEDVDRSIDSEHEIVPAWQDLCPRRPDHELPIVDHLLGLIGVGSGANNKDIIGLYKEKRVGLELMARKEERKDKMDLSKQIKGNPKTKQFHSTFNLVLTF